MKLLFCQLSDRAFRQSPSRVLITNSKLPELSEVLTNHKYKRVK